MGAVLLDLDHHGFAASAGGLYTDYAAGHVVRVLEEPGVYQRLDRNWVVYCVDELDRNGRRGTTRVYSSNKVYCKV